MRSLERSLPALVRDLWAAARPFSLSLAFYSTSLPAALAFRAGLVPGAEPRLGLFRLILVTAAGLSVQAATNLINDHFETGQRVGPAPSKLYRFLGQERGAFDILVFFSGLACFGFTALVGLYLALTTSGALFAVGAIGLVGGYCYTGEPVVYKRFGLGALLSFVLLGPLMNFGAWLGLGGAAAFGPVLASLPVSLLIPAMMFANEIRDVERDAAMGIRTATVRMGRRAGQALYDALLALSFLLVPANAALGLVPPAALASLAALPLAFRARARAAAGRSDMIPATNLLHLVFGALYAAGIVLG